LSDVVCEAIDERSSRLRSESKSDIKTLIRRIFEQYQIRPACGRGTKTSTIEVSPSGGAPKTPACAITVRIDATPRAPLCDAGDEKHWVAVKHLESMAASEFAVCDAVLKQTCFHLPHRQRLRGFLEDLGVQPVPLANESAFRLDVFGWLIKYAGHEPDCADGCLAVLSGRDRDAKVWTYDREFRTTWRQPNGTVIPLAMRLT
jgi:hypothetical protein